MRPLLFTFILFLGAQQCVAQFWFGPKVGFHRTGFKYQDERHEFLIGNDVFVQNQTYDKVKPNYNFHVGGMMTYTASVRYAVHIELFYERVVKRISSPANVYEVDNKFKYNFLSLPLMLRVIRGREPVYYYVNAGPKLSFWMSGKGRIFTDLFNELGDPPLEFKVRYDIEKELADDELAIDNPNRIQYALNVGGGVMMDLKTGGRLQLDLRYSWGHSNMGFNRDSQLEEFLENVEFSNQIVSASVGYLFGYNPADARKGTSTNKLTNKGKKNKKSKKRKSG